MALHPHLSSCNSFLKSTGGFAISGHDDTYLVGPPQAVWEALGRHRTNISTINLTGQLAKFFVYSPSGSYGNKPDDVRIGSALDLHKNVESLDDAEKLRLSMLMGIKIYGNPLGDVGFMHDALSLKSGQIANDAKKVVDLISPLSKQSSWCCVYYALQHKFDYFLQNIAPIHTLPHAAALDIELHRISELSLGFDLRDPLSSSRLRLPIRLRGGGIRRLTDIAGPAYIGTLCKVLPRFVDREDLEHNVLRGLFPHLDSIFGARAFYPDGSRFSFLLGGTLQLASYMSNAWDLMRNITHSGPLEDTTPGLVDTSQGKLQEAIDAANLASTEALLPSSSDRSRRAWFHLDSFSSVFLHALPDPVDGGLCSDIFTEVAANYFFQPSPTLRDLVNHPIYLKNSTILCDAFGDALTSCTLSGNGHKICHDSINSSCFRMVRDAGIYGELEPSHLFLHAVPNSRRDEFLAQQGDDGDRKRSFVPDFMAHTLADDSHTISRPHLFETKSLTYCPTWYNSDNRLSAVETRANRIPGEYERKARTLDVKYNATPRNTNGPIFSSLSSYGKIQTLVFGRFSETSVDVSRLIKICAVIKARRLVHSFGGDPADMAQMRAHFARSYKRKIALTSLTSKARLLLDRKIYVNLPYRMHNSAKGRSDIPPSYGFGDHSWFGQRGRHFYEPHRS